MIEREKLKKIIETDDTQAGVSDFKEILEQERKNIKVMNEQDYSLLLRWAVKAQKKHFRSYYDQLTNLGADVSFTDTREKKSNLMIACEGTNVEIVQVLVKDKNMKFCLEDHCKKNALYYAIQTKNKQKAEIYVQLILNQDPSLLTFPNSKNNKTFLISAIEKGRLEVVKLLLERGADPNEQVADDGNTPLHEAVKVMKSKPFSTNFQIIQCLLERGADPNIQNKQKKTPLQIAEKHAEKIKLIYEKAKQIRQGIKPILIINTGEERTKMFQEAAAIFKNNEFCLQSAENEQESSNSDSCSDDEPYEGPQHFYQSLTNDIHAFNKDCFRDYENARKQITKFIEEFDQNVKRLNLMVEVYGSFATGLWLKHCDIDLVLSPTKKQTQMKTVDQYLDEVMGVLQSMGKHTKITKLKNIKVPMIRVEIGDKTRKSTCRKIDISIQDINHNGKQHVMYIKQLMSMYSSLRPLFYVIKRLTHLHKLNDPKNSGIRTYAIILMLALFLQQNGNIHSLGELLLRFLYRFGYKHEYGYLSESEMLLDLPDPVKPTNNVGNQTDVNSLQRMFKSSYIVLHSKTRGSKLDYLFEGKNIFI